MENTPYLKQTESGLVLASDDQELICDFSDLKRRLKPNNLNSELCVKAARFKKMPEHPTLVDATAGLGHDALLLAAYGFNVTLFERDEIIHALLFDGIKRALLDPELSEAASRMTLYKGDSILELKRLDFTPDVVLLDPMFPERKKSGLVKKKFQMLHLLEKPCEDEEELMAAALASNATKIIVKRPVTAEYLAGKKPNYQVQDKIIRYDIITNSSI